MEIPAVGTFMIRKNMVAVFFHNYLHSEVKVIFIYLFFY
jgi:hypothetical protein